MQGETILVLGGAGFIGSNLTNQLVKLGANVRVYTRSGRSIKNLSPVLNDIELIYGDFMDEVRLRNAIKGADKVVHLISTTFPGTTIDSGIYDISSNLIPTVRLMDFCVKEGIEKVVYLSSGGTIYGESKSSTISEEQALEPTSLYGQSKKVIESYIQYMTRAYGIDTTILRASNPYGPLQNPYGVQGIIPVAFACALENRVFNVFGDGSAVRDYLYISDLIDAIARSLSDNTPEVLNISSGMGRSALDIIQAIEKTSGIKINRRYTEARTGDVTMNVLSNKKALETLDWSPKVSFTNGISQTWEWIQQEIKGQS